MRMPPALSTFLVPVMPLLLFVADYLLVRYLCKNCNHCSSICASGSKQAAHRKIAKRLARPEHILREELTEMQSEWREVSNQVEELRSEVAKLQRAVEKGWLGAEHMTHLKSERDRYEALLVVKEKSMEEVEARLEALLREMQENGMQDEEAEAIFKSVFGRSRVFQKPLKPAIKGPQSRTTPTKRVRFNLDTQ